MTRDLTRGLDFRIVLFMAQAFRNAAAVREVEALGYKVNRLCSEPTRHGHMFKADVVDAEGAHHMVYGSQVEDGDFAIDVWASDEDLFAGLD